jgi:hypothetical protein
VINWVAKILNKNPMPNGGFAGYAPGRLFDPGALRAVYVTSQHRPWYGVEGPGTRVQGQLAVVQPTQVAQQMVTSNSLVGDGGSLSGTYSPQPLSLPSQAGSNVGSI